MFGKAIEQGVREGLSNSFKPGGAFTQALDTGLAPLTAELNRLRRLERRMKWHPMETVPAWAKDGRPILLNQAGSMVWAAWVDDDDGGWWDGDLEYGGEPLDPAPTHFFLVPTPPPNPEATTLSDRLADEDKHRLNPNPTQQDQGEPRE